MTLSSAGIDRSAEIRVLPADLRRVLIVMIDRHLGNTVISLPVIDRLSAHFTGAVDVLVDERYAGLVRLLPSGPRVIGYPEQSRKRRGIFDNLRPAVAVLRTAASRYSCVIDVGGGTRSANLTFWSLALRRVALRARRHSWIYSQTVEASDAAHFFDRYARLLRVVGVEQEPAVPRLRASSEARAAVARELAATGRDPARPLVLFHVGAGDRHRLYPVARFAEAALELVRSFAAQVCVIGSASERDLMGEFIAHANVGRDAFAIQPPIEQLLALYDEAALLISNEGGPTHLAAMTELPIVTLFGPSREKLWRPLRERDVTILRGATCDPACRRSHCVADLRCLTNTTPAQIVAAAAVYLARRHLPSASA